MSKLDDAYNRVKAKLENGDHIAVILLPDDGDFVRAVLCPCRRQIVKNAQCAIRKRLGIWPLVRPSKRCHWLRSKHGWRHERLAKQPGLSGSLFPYDADLGCCMPSASIGARRDARFERSRSHQGFQ